MNRFEEYREFVNNITSGPSKYLADFNSRLEALSISNLDVPRFITAGTGIASESGEILELVKKILFQGKEFNQETKVHLQKELGDLFWYFTQMCIVLDTTPDEIMKQNQAKLMARYPDGFSVEKSEFRKKDDI